MKLKLITGLLAGGILALGGNLGAQEGKWSFSGAIGLPTDDLNSVTGSGTGWWNIGAYNLNVGYTGKFAGTGIPFRASLGYNYCPAGNAPFERTSDLWWMIEPQQIGLTGVQLAGDLYIDPKLVDSLRFIIGMSLTKWSMSYLQTNTDFHQEFYEWYFAENEYFVPADWQRHSMSVPGLKFGFRIGLEFQMSPQASLEVIYQMQEMGHSNMTEKWIPFTTDRAEPGDPWMMPDYGPTAWNPSWLQVGFKFRF